MKRRSVFTTTFFIILFLCVGHVTAFAGEQGFSLSKNLSFDNRGVKTAIDPVTGNALVVWMRRGSGNISLGEIYAAFCKMKANGKYRVYKAKLVSEKTNQTGWNPDVAYNRADKSFMVVWSTRDKSGNSPYQLRSRRVSVKGKLDNSYNVLVSSSLAYRHPVIACTEDPGSPATAAESAAYVLAYDISSNTAKGLYACKLNADGSLYGEHKKLLAYKESPGNYPTQIERALDGTFLISHVCTDAKTIAAPYMATVTSGLSLKKNLSIGTKKTRVVCFIQLSKRKIIASWFDYEKEFFSNQMLNNKLKKRKGAFAPVDALEARFSTFAEAHNGGVLQLSQVMVFSGGPMYQCYSRPINSLGKYTDQGRMVFAEDMLVSTISAVKMPEDGKLFVVYVVNRAPGSYEIRGIIHDYGKKHGM